MKQFEHFKQSVLKVIGVIKCISVHTKIPELNYTNIS